MTQQRGRELACKIVVRELQYDQISKLAYAARNRAGQLIVRHLELDQRVLENKYT